MTTEAVAVREVQPLAQRDELSIDDLVAQVQKIQTAMQRVMKKDEHYGVIPGTDKPSLLKPGAEKLCLLFRLDPQYEVMEDSIVRDDFISYSIRCTLWHITSGQRIASGLGACNSREAKYRYRYVATNQSPDTETAARLKAAGHGRWRKVGEAWVWHERIEHDNPWDFDNTVKKMACKRALVAAVLNGTAASDIFTQDLEDLVANGVIDTTATASERVTSAPQVATTPAREDGATKVVRVEEKTGKNQKTGKEWTTYTVTVADGRSGSTFDASLAETARKAQVSEQLVVPVFERKGQYTNLVTLAPAPEATSSADPVATLDEQGQKKLWAIAKAHGWSETSVRGLLAQHGYEATKDVTMEDYPKLLLVLKQGPPTAGGAVE